MKDTHEQLAIYQTENGALELRQDFDNDTIWASQKQIAEIFGIERSVVTKHIRSIFLDNELDEKVVSAKFAQTTSHGAITGKTQTKDVNFYSLDIILAVGYRTKSSMAIAFRQWASQTLKQHITQGFTFNHQRIEQNRKAFLKAVDDIRLLTQNTTEVPMNRVLDLVQVFAETWFTLDQYDKGEFPQQGRIENVDIQAKDLQESLEVLKQELVSKGEATHLFAEEKSQGNLSGIVGNVFQSVFGQDAYATIEEKAAHLLYFIIKNHPFNDGNKRSGAFAFVWFLQKAQFDFGPKISPETLTTLTLLVAESDPKDKERMIGVILLILQ